MLLDEDRCAFADLQEPHSTPELGRYLSALLAWNKKYNQSHVGGFLWGRPSVYDLNRLVSMYRKELIEDAQTIEHDYFAPEKQTIAANLGARMVRECGDLLRERVRRHAKDPGWLKELILKRVSWRYEALEMARHKPPGIAETLFEGIDGALAAVAQAAWEEMEKKEEAERAKKSLPSPTPEDRAKRFVENVIEGVKKEHSDVSAMTEYMEERFRAEINHARTRGDTELVEKLEQERDKLLNRVLRGGVNP